MAYRNKDPKNTPPEPRSSETAKLEEKEAQKKNKGGAGGRAGAGRGGPRRGDIVRNGHPTYVQLTGGRFAAPCSVEDPFPEPTAVDHNHLAGAFTVQSNTDLSNGIRGCEVDGQGATDNGRGSSKGAIRAAMNTLENINIGLEYSHEVQR